MPVDAAYPDERARLEGAEPRLAASWTRAGRTLCQSPMCWNSSARFAGCNGYLCSRHWRDVPRWMKVRRSRLARRLIRLGELQDGKAAYTACTPRAGRLMDAAWKGMVRAAIYRASGL